MVKYSSLTNKNILLASEVALTELAKKFPTAKNYEKLVQCFLLGYFHGKRVRMELEHKVRGRQSVDFRFLGDNRALMELATMKKLKRGKPANWQGSAYVNTNELVKLMNQTRGRAQRRVLLILDFHNETHLRIDNLKNYYGKKWRQLLSKYRWKKHKLLGVNVLYLHHDGARYSISLSKNGRVAGHVFE